MVDAIFCITVLEHLNKPLATAVLFHRFLRPGGVLVFDYIKGTGEALDTMHGVRERSAVLDFIAANFDVAHGALRHDASMGITLAVKRT
jgi:hypothetical protein